MKEGQVEEEEELQKITVYVVHAKTGKSTTVVGVFTAYHFAQMALRTLKNTVDSIYITHFYADQGSEALALGKSPYSVTFHEDGTVDSPTLVCALPPDAGNFWVWYGDELEERGEGDGDAEVHTTVWAATPQEALHLARELYNEGVKEFRAAGGSSKAL